MEDPTRNLENFKFLQRDRTTALGNVIIQLQEKGLLPEHLEGLSVLDLGAGNGNGAIAFKEKGAEILAVETSQIIVEDTLKQGFLAPNEIRQGSIPPVLDEYNDDEFDVITAFGATLPIDAMLYKSARILKVGGRVVVTTHFGERQTLERLDLQMRVPSSSLSRLGYRSYGVTQVNAGIYDDPYCLVTEKIMGVRTTKKEGSNEVMDVGTLRDNFSGEPVAEALKLLRRGFDRSQSPIIRFYLACSNEQLDTILAYLKTELGLDEQKVLQVNIDPAKIISGIADELYIMADMVSELPGKKVLVLAKGFEGFSLEKRGWDVRTGHHYDQVIGENKRLVERYIECGKKVALITHISSDLDKEVYSRALQHAAASQFKNGFIIID